MGGMFVSGRWHHRGTLIVYTTSTPSLASLEMLVHVDPSSAPSSLQLVEISVPDDLQVETVLDPSSITPEWRSYPAPPALADFGTRWAREQRTPLLRVPSALSFSDAESNVLLNPTHPLAARASVVGTTHFTFDTRLLR
jgi:RES domain-containing protein